MIELKPNVDGRVPVTLEQVRMVARGTPVKVAPAIYKMLDERRAQIVKKVRESGLPAYGFNRGFGHNVDLPVSPERANELQRNLILSHACGVGDPAPVEVVRAAMFLRIASLARGHSGVRATVVRQLVKMLNKHVTPVVPWFGSVGASGDLAPLSHIALGALGEGEAYFGKQNRRMKASTALSKAGLKPLQLEMKEGLALNNGVQFSNAVGILSWFTMRDLVRTASITTACTAQVMLGADTSFLRDLHRLRPHPGSVKVAAWIHGLMKGSKIRKAHERYDIDSEVQDPYNLRCAAAVLGTCYDLVEGARETFEIEANSVTDNPVLLKEKGEYTRIVSGGLFHGMPIAVKLYDLMQAMSIMARLANMRCVRYVDEARNKGLGADLKWPGLTAEEAAGTSGMMMPEYVSAALTNWIWGASMPTHLFSLSTDAGQEDHVSMSGPIAVRVWQTLPRIAEVLAVELAFATQASAIRQRMDYIPSKVSLDSKVAKALELNPEKYGDDIEALRKSRRDYDKAITQFLKKAERDLLGRKRFKVSLELKLKHLWAETERPLSPVCEKVIDHARKTFPTLKRDRVLSGQIQALAKQVLEGKIAELAELPE
jgi:histidine ammonia-lyase